MSSEAEQLKLLRRYTLPIVHLRQQLYEKRLSLFFGSGIGRDLKFPVWPKLISGIQTKAVGRGVEKPQKYTSLTYHTQILFQKFIAKRLSDSDISSLPRMENRIATIKWEWRMMVHDVLYAKPETVETQAIDSHPYLPQFRPLFKWVPLIVNYNFDDVIERLIQKHREAHEKATSLGYESFWTPRAHTRPDRVPIYHPNGFLPSNLQEKHSETLIFSEDEFADQLTDLSGSSYQYLFQTISRYTALLVGLSLDDGTLKNLLRQNAKLHPGNFHYYVRFLERPDELTQHEQEAIAAANFEIYNLITLFLTKDEHRILAELLNMPPPQGQGDVDLFEQLAKDIETKFVFYVAGSVASGKTTLISQFRSTYVFDEWLEPRIQEIVDRWDELTPDETKTADEWVLRQVRMKNSNLLKVKAGIYFVDRAPLDAFAFTPDDKLKEKAEMIEKEVCRGSSRKPLQKGHVIVLQADPAEMERRTRLRGRSKIDESYLEIQQGTLAKVYNDPMAVSQINTRCKAPSEIARQVATLVFQQSYQAFDCDARLAEVRKEGTL